MSIGTAFRPLRSYGLLFALLALIGLTLFALSPMRPHFYQPARPSLTEAKRHLDSFYADEKLLLQELSQTREQLNQTLDLLSKAELQLSYRQRRQLESLRQRLHQLDDLRVTQVMTTDRLHETYLQLASELSTLIESLQ